jgi:hypothetical protein
VPAGVVQFRVTTPLLLVAFSEVGEDGGSLFLSSLKIMKNSFSR